MSASFELDQIRDQLARPRCFKRPVLVNQREPTAVVEITHRFTFLSAIRESTLVQSHHPIRDWRAMVTWFNGEGLSVTAGAGFERDPQALRIGEHSFCGTQELTDGALIGMGPLEFRVFDLWPTPPRDPKAQRVPPTVSIVDRASGATLSCAPLLDEVTLIGSSRSACDVIISEAPEVAFSVLRRKDGDLEVVQLNSEAPPNERIISTDLVTDTKSYALPRGWCLVVRSSGRAHDSMSPDLPRSHWQLSSRERFGRYARHG